MSEINKKLKLSFSGRLDAHGAKKLEYDLNDCLHKGEHNILLNLEATEYISSAGIRILLLFRKKLTAIDGTFNVIVSDTGNVKQILEMSQLTMLIASVQSDQPLKESVETFSGKNIDYEILDKRDGGFEISVIGSSEKLVSGTYDKEDSHNISFPAEVVAMGIGAFGENFEVCREHFGEFLTFGGVALTRPPGSSEVDYIISQGEIVPKGCMLSGIKLKGEFSTVFRFSTRKKDESITLSTLCSETLKISKADSIVMVAAVDVADIVGVALTRSPANKTQAENIFAFPEIRNWLSFTGEPIYKGKTSLIAGIVSKDSNNLKNKTLKSLGAGIFGMVKAGIFSYNPISREQIDLKITIQNIFRNHKLIDLLHLVNDNRKLLGAGESSFFRGTVWCAEIIKENL